MEDNLNYNKLKILITKFTASGELPHIWIEYLEQLFSLWTPNTSALNLGICPIGKWPLDNDLLLFRSGTEDIVVSVLDFLALDMTKVKYQISIKILSF